MPIYTVHEPPPRKGESAASPERYVFVRDGFRLWAFLLAPFWMLVNRLWLVLLGYVVLNAALALALTLLRAPGGARFAVMLALAFLVGLEAGTLKRWTLRKWKTVGTVSADNAEAAERRFFDAWAKTRDVAPPVKPAPAPLPPTPSVITPRRRAEGNDVLGLFPRPNNAP